MQFYKKISYAKPGSYNSCDKIKAWRRYWGFCSKFVNENHIHSAWIISCADSLINYNMRFANQEEGSKGSGHFEIVSLSGTLSVNGSHVHLSISDSTGKTIGGHLLEGCVVYTTAEIIIGESMDLVFIREKDGTTPWDELQREKKD